MSSLKCLKRIVKEFKIHNLAELQKEKGPLRQRRREFQNRTLSNRFEVGERKPNEERSNFIRNSNLDSKFKHASHSILLTGLTQPVQDYEELTVWKFK